MFVDYARYLFTSDEELLNEKVIAVNSELSQPT